MSHGQIERIDLANLPTPLERAERTGALVGAVSLWIKRDDLTGMGVSGNKVRKLEYTAAEAVGNGADTLITCGGIQSNHCRATAAVAARLGLSCRLVLNGKPPSVPEGNHFLDLLFGARCSFVSGVDLDGMRGAMEKAAEECRREGKKPFIIPLGASDATGSLGYVQAVEELAGQSEGLGLGIDRIVIPTGSGGTLAGITAGVVSLGLPWKITAFSVAFPSTFFDTKTRELFDGLREKYIPELGSPEGRFEVNDDYIGEGYGLTTPEQLGFIARVAAAGGLLLDPTYTGKAMWGLSGELKCGRIDPAENIVFIHTGGAFGLFAYREGFSEVLNNS